LRCLDSLAALQCAAPALGYFQDVQRSRFLDHVRNPRNARELAGVGRNCGGINPVLRRRSDTIKQPDRVSYRRSSPLPRAAVHHRHCLRVVPQPNKSPGRTFPNPPADSDKSSFEALGVAPAYIPGRASSMRGEKLLIGKQPMFSFSCQSHIVRFFGGALRFLSRINLGGRTAALNLERTPAHFRSI